MKRDGIKKYFGIIGRVVLKYGISFAVMLGVFLLGLVFASLFSRDKSVENTKESVPVFMTEGVFPTYTAALDRYYGQDNFTDGLMLNIATNIYKGKPLTEVMEMNYLMVEDGNFNAIDDLFFLYYDESTELTLASVDYSRYWHGYIVFLKPLLSILNYQQIRNLLFILLYVLFFLMLFCVCRKLGFKYGLAYGIGFAMVNFRDIWMTMAYSGIFMISLISLILLTRNNTEWMEKKFPLYCFFVGGITSFIDLLSTPMISWGLLALYVVVYLMFVNDFEFIKTFLLIFKSGLAWGIGFGSIWVSKWLIGSLVLKDDLVHNALSLGSSWTSSIPEGFTNRTWLKYVFDRNLNFLFEGDSKFGVFVIAVLVVSILAIWSKRKPKQNKLMAIALVFAIGVLPYVWYIIVKVHSGVHAFFTYRNQILSVVSLFLILLYFIDGKKLIAEIAGPKGEKMLSSESSNPTDTAQKE